MVGDSICGDGYNNDGQCFHLQIIVDTRKLLFCDFDAPHFLMHLFVAQKQISDPLCRSDT